MKRIDFESMAVVEVNDVRDHVHVPPRRGYFLRVTCETKADLGPGMVLGELAACWKDPSKAEIKLDPPSLNFGKVWPQEITDRRLRIHNDGGAPLRVTLSQPAGSVFRWKELRDVTVQPGEYREQVVTFHPQSAGTSTSLLTVQHDGLGPERTVKLQGEMRQGIPR